MLKIAALLFNSIALFFYNMFFADPVTLTQSIPSTVKVGTEITVEITVNKGSNSGFAKLQQELPVGFTAVEGQSSGGTFTFMNQAVKIIWMSLPESPTYKISYKIKATADAVGKHQIGGKISYVSDNVKQTAEISPAQVEVISDAPTIVKTPEKAAEPIAPIATPEPVKTNVYANLNCTRKIPESIIAGNEFVVDVVIDKGNLTGFAKLVETMPEGFTVSALETSGASFTFENQKASFVWASLPNQANIQISYRVKLNSSLEGEKLVEGVFSFMENNQTMKYVLQPGFIKVVQNTSATAVTSISTTEKAIVEPVLEKVESAVTTETKSPEPPQELMATSIPVAQTNGKVNYKVQILALKTPKEIQQVVTYFNLSATVTLEMAEGYTKYTTGFYPDYKTARDERENLKQNPKLSQSFVTAYNYGKRITVQEAIMISNQKWYK